MSDYFTAAEFEDLQEVQNGTFTPNPYLDKGQGRRRAKLLFFCPECGGETRTIASQPHQSGRLVRNRQCYECEHRFKTEEDNNGQGEVLYTPAAVDESVKDTFWTLRWAIYNSQFRSRKEARIYKKALKNVKKRLKIT